MQFNRDLYKDLKEIKTIVDTSLQHKKISEFKEEMKSIGGTVKSMIQRFPKEMESEDYIESDKISVGWLYGSVIFFGIIIFILIKWC